MRHEPLSLVRLAAIALAAILLGACGGFRNQPESPEPEPEPVSMEPQEPEPEPQEPEPEPQEPEPEPVSMEPQEPEPEPVPEEVGVARVQGPEELPVAPLPGPTSVQPGDIIQIEFWRQPELSGERVVDRYGQIQLPLLRGVEVQGLTTEEIRERLTESYRQFYSDPLIVVNVKLGVNVTGAVRAPGRYTVDPAFNLFDAIGVAGGLQFDGKRDEIQLVREGQQYVINLDAALVSGQAPDLRLQSGDWIFVPRRFWTLQRVTTYLTVMVLFLQALTLLSL